ncbi:MAG: hypothetical protein ACJ75J_13775 [Cytophagaceae bacterium]
MTPLAWSKQPEPKGLLYSFKELSDKKSVTALFYDCSISQGYITADGWEFLFKHYGTEELLALARESGWLPENKAEHLSALVYQSLISGYNPIDQQKGDYDPESGIFLSLDGSKKIFEWDKI